MPCRIPDQGLISNSTDHLPLSPVTSTGQEGGGDLCSLKEGAGFVPEVKGPACLFAKLEMQPFQPVCQLNCSATCFVYAIKPGSCLQCAVPEGTGSTEWTALNPLLKLHQALEMWREGFCLADRFILSHIPVIPVEETAWAKGMEYSSWDVAGIARAPKTQAHLAPLGIKVRLSVGP